MVALAGGEVRRARFPFPAERTAGKGGYAVRRPLWLFAAAVLTRPTETGVTVLAQGPGFEVEGGEPVLVDGRLYVRQIALRHSAQNEGRGPYAKGNLICYDLRAGAEGN